MWENTAPCTEFPVSFVPWSVRCSWTLCWVLFLCCFRMLRMMHRTSSRNNFPNISEWLVKKQLNTHLCTLYRQLSVWRLWALHFSQEICFLWGTHRQQPFSPVSDLHQPDLQETLLSNMFPAQGYHSPCRSEQRQCQHVIYHQGWCTMHNMEWASAIKLHKRGWGGVVQAKCDIRPVYVKT